jgi:hypothetical protein
MIRDIAWCINTGCKEFSKKKLSSSEANWICSKCKLPGGYVKERAIDEDTHNGVYKTVRVEFNYDVLERRYREIAIVDIPSLRSGGIYTQCNPFCSTEKRALDIGTTLICSLNCGSKEDGVLGQTIISLDADREHFSAALEALGEKLNERERRILDGR